MPRLLIPHNVPLFSDQVLLSAGVAKGAQLQRVVYELCELLFTDRADLRRLNFAVLENHQGRYTTHVVITRGLLIVVNIDLGDLDLAGIARCQLVENRRNHFARTAPLCPEINQHWLCGFQYFGIELVVTDMADRAAQKSFSG